MTQTNVLFRDLWNYHQPAETATKFQALLDDTPDDVSAEYHLQLLTQLARTHGLRHQFDKAHAILDRVEAQLTNQTPVAHIRYLLERGRSYNSNQQKDLALPLFVEAWERGVSVSADFHAVDAAHMVAIAEPHFEQQLDWNLKAMTLAEKSEDGAARGWLGSLYNNIGHTYHDVGRFDEALSIFEKGVAWQKEHLPKTLRNYRIARWCVGRVFRSMGRVDDAIALQEELLPLNLADNLPVGFIHEELAELYVQTDRAEEAPSHFSAAYEILKDLNWFVQSYPQRLERLKSLGNLS